MYKRYGKYKDSGIEWIGDVPEHWSVNKLGYLLEKNDGGVWGDDPKENGLIVLRSTEITLDGRWNINEPAKRSLSNKEFNNALLKKGDLLLTKSSGSEQHIGKTAIADDSVADLRCAFSNFMQRLRTKRMISPNYLYYFLNNNGREQLLYLSTTTTGLKNLSGSIINNLKIQVPTINEQHIITNYLNKKTSEIDSLIADKEELIKKLEEYKQSIITEAVTKGLNPDVKMKDSGIEWIGEIPEHWSIVKMRYLLDKIKTGSTPTTQNQSYFDGDIDWFTPADFVDIKLASSKRKISLQALIDGEAILFEENTVLLVGIGATIGKVAMTNKKCSSNQQITGLTTKSNRMLPLYLTYWLHLNQKLIKAFSNNTTLPILNNEGIRSLYCILPPLKEQTAIANYLEQETLRIDELILDIEDHKDQLREYRQSLIYEAVTGKIDVCDYQPERSEQFA